MPAMKCAVQWLSAAVLLFGLFRFAYADEFTSSGFKVLDPVFSPGGFSSSTDYTNIGAITQIAIGTSTSAGFVVNAGFTSFPFVSSPVVTSTAGDGQVALSWAAVTGFLGWTISSYNVGQSTASGGPYTYSSVGNVTSSARTRLSNRTL